LVKGGRAVTGGAQGRFSGVMKRVYNAGVRVCERRGAGLSGGVPLTGALSCRYNAAFYTKGVLMEHVPVRKKAALSGRAVVRLCLAALFAAFIAAGAYIAIPLPFTPVPVTVQNFFALLGGLVLGPLHGALAVVLYLLAGAVGAPVFAGAVGGFVHFLAPSGGYLWGYLLCAFTAGLIAHTPAGAVPPAKGFARFFRIACAALCGMAAVYLPGLLWLKKVSGGSWLETFAWGLFPFVAGDLLKTALAVLLAPRLRKAAARVQG
jgi:biotin transport system substrate-specific component